MCRFQKCVFALRKSRWCCGLKRVTASVSVPVSLLLTRCRPTTLPPKHRASGKCTSLSPRCLVVVMQRRSAGLPWNKLRICCFDYCLVLDCGDSTQTDVLRINMNSDEWQITPQWRVSLFLQLGGSRPLWEQQRSHCSGFAKLWSSPSPVPSSVASIAGPASGREGASRLLCAQGKRPLLWRAVEWKRLGSQKFPW